MVDEKHSTLETIEWKNNNTSSCFKHASWKRISGKRISHLDLIGRWAGYKKDVFIVSQDPINNTKLVITHQYDDIVTDFSFPISCRHGKTILNAFGVDWILLDLSSVDELFWLRKNFNEHESMKYVRWTRLVTLHELNSRRIAVQSSKVSNITNKPEYTPKLEAPVMGCDEAIPHKGLSCPSKSRPLPRAKPSKWPIKLQANYQAKAKSHKNKASTSRMSSPCRAKATRAGKYKYSLDSWLNSPRSLSTKQRLAKSMSVKPIEYEQVRKTLVRGLETSCAQKMDAMLRRKRRQIIASRVKSIQKEAYPYDKKTMKPPFNLKHIAVIESTSTIPNVEGKEKPANKIPTERALVPAALASGLCSYTSPARRVDVVRNVKGINSVRWHTTVGLVSRMQRTKVSEI